MKLQSSTALARIAGGILCVLTTLSACSQERARDKAASWIGPPPAGPPPHAANVNPAPLNNVASGARPDRLAERAEGRVLDLGHHETTVQLHPLTGETLKGSAELEEVGGTVQVKLAVRDAPPGTLQVSVHERGPCTGLYVPEQDGGVQSSASRLLPQTMSVGKDGHGTAELTAPRANLDAEDPETLLGKALVIARLARGAHSSTALACAEIREN
jgi:Cu/Zn superoxide dismutase